MSTESSMQHLWHIWINKYADSLPKEEWPSSLYEFTDMLQFRSYGHQLLKKAFEGNLLESHRQCSHSLPVPILNNTLKCAIGTSVTECQILLGLKTSFEERRDSYKDIPSDKVYELMRDTCAWHIYTTDTGTPKGHHFGDIDTSEGYMQDESDRMFWRCVYDSMSYDPSDES